SGCGRSSTRSSSGQTRATSTEPSTTWPRSPRSRSRSRPRCSGPARAPMRAPDELLRLVEDYLAGLTLSPDLGAQRESMLYALEGGKRIRAVICLGTAEAAGGDVDAALPAAAALELVHAFSLVHDDLPAMDDDDERRGRPSAHAAFGEGVALLAGDGLLVEAFRLALTYSSTGVARELADATLGMIGGQYLD